MMIACAIKPVLSGGGGGNGGGGLGGGLGDGEIAGVVASLATSVATATTGEDGEGVTAAVEQLGMARDVNELATPGFDTSAVKAGAAPPLTHTQHGSPSSIPLD